MPRKWLISGMDKFRVLIQQCLRLPTGHLQPERIRAKIKLAVPEQFTAVSNASLAKILVVCPRGVNSSAGFAGKIQHSFNIIIESQPNAVIVQNLQCGDLFHQEASLQHNRDALNLKFQIHLPPGGNSDSGENYMVDNSRTGLRRKRQYAIMRATRLRAVCTKRETPSRKTRHGALKKRDEEQFESASAQRAMLCSPLGGARSTGKNRQTGQTQGQQRQSRAVIRDGILVTRAASRPQVNQLVLGRVATSTC